jgi:hypothetical protein
MLRHHRSNTLITPTLVMTKSNFSMFDPLLGIKKKKKKRRKKNQLDFYHFS